MSCSRASHWCAAAVMATAEAEPCPFEEGYLDAAGASKDKHVTLKVDQAFELSHAVDAEDQQALVQFEHSKRHRKLDSDRADFDRHHCQTAEDTSAAYARGHALE